VGYKGTPLPGLPFDERKAVIPNQGGRVIGDGALGIYAAGWIKRGPSGLIGSNKGCARETVDRMLEDLAAGKLLPAENTSLEAVDRMLAERGIDFVSYDDWVKIDLAEVERGKAQGRPRVKITAMEEFMKVLGRG
jgi:ferredoxin--NADP+ reductase